MRLVRDRVLVDLVLRVAADRGATAMHPELRLVRLHVRQRGLEGREHRVAPADAHPRTSIGTSRKRACAAPCPTRMSCSGSPLAHERKPCKSQSSATPSHRPQNAGVSDWNETPRA